jgi:AcrR family transcriptional regulator
MTNPDGYRGLRRTLSRQALLESATELIGQRGLSAVSVDEIVERAGVAKGTFYNHFRDKQDIAQQIALGIRYEIRDRIAGLKVGNPDPARHLAIALTLFLQLAVHKPQRARMLATLLSKPADIEAPMNARVRQTLESGSAAGRFVFNSLDAALAFVLGVVAGGIHLLADTSGEGHERELIAGLVGHALTGLGLPMTEAQGLTNETLSEVLDAQ